MRFASRKKEKPCLHHVVEPPPISLPDIAGSAVQCHLWRSLPKLVGMKQHAMADPFGKALLEYVVVSSPQCCEK